MSGPFEDVRVVGNRVQVTPSIVTNPSFSFTGIYVATPFSDQYPGTPVAPVTPPAAATPSAATPSATDPTASAPAPGGAVPLRPVATVKVTPLFFQLPSKTNAAAATAKTMATRALASYVGDRSLTVNPDAFFAASSDPQAGEIGGNVVDVVPSRLPLIEAIVIGACVLRANRVALSTATSAVVPSPPPTGVVPTVPIVAAAQGLVAGDNYVNAYSSDGTIPGIYLVGYQATVLGNISTTGIWLNNRRLGQPWAALNTGS